MTNLRAAQVKASNLGDFYASTWTDVSVEKLKAFIGLRLSVEYAVVKRRPEHYFSSKTGFLFATLGYRDVFKRDGFLALWKFLHVCDEESAATDKTDKLYKVPPVLNYTVPFCRSGQPISVLVMQRQNGN